VFTAEEVWGSRYPDGGSVHLLEWPQVPTAEVSKDFMVKWAELRALRRQVTEAIEPLRRDKTLGSSLEAEVTLSDIGAMLGGYQDDKFLAELFISGAVTLKKGTEPPIISRTQHHKCGRCWRLLPEVTEDGALCHRCEDVVAQMDSVA